MSDKMTYELWWVSDKDLNLALPLGHNFPRVPANQSVG